MLDFNTWTGSRFSSLNGRYCVSVLSILHSRDFVRLICILSSDTEATDIMTGYSSVYLQTATGIGGIAGAYSTPKWETPALHSTRDTGFKTDMTYKTKGLFHVHLCTKG